MSGQRASVEERLWRNCIPEPNSGCWIWMGSLGKFGYGQIMMPGGKPRRAHRISYQVYKGPIPKELDVMHSCDIRCCINPDHLSVGTRKQNMEDALKRGRVARGFQLPQTKLTSEQRSAIVTDKRLHQEIAAEYGVTSSFVSHIKRKNGVKTIRPAYTYSTKSRPSSAGENHHEAKLSWEKVARIRDLYRRKAKTQTQLAQQFSVSQAQISRILLNRAWTCGQ